MSNHYFSHCFRPLVTALGLTLFSSWAVALTTANYYPVAPGNSWTYAEVKNGVSSTVISTVSPNKVLFNGTYVYEIVESTGEKDYLLNDQNGYREFGGYIPGIFVSGYGTTTVTATASPPLFVPASFSIGQTYNGTSQLTYVYTGVANVVGQAT